MRDSKFAVCRAYPAVDAFCTLFCDARSALSKAAKALLLEFKVERRFDILSVDDHDRAFGAERFALAGITVRQSIQPVQPRIIKVGSVLRERINLLGKPGYFAN